MTICPRAHFGRPAPLTAALAAAAGLALAASTASAGPISGMYVFGDSSADVGSTPRRTTNAGDLWTQTVAAALGFTDAPARSVVLGPRGIVSSTPKGGTNYAIIGATVQNLGDSATLGQEIDAFAEDHGRFDPDALVLIWATRNDITTGFFDNVGFDPRAYAAAYRTDLDRLHALGARRIVAFNSETNLLPLQLLADAGYPAALVDRLRALSAASNVAVAPVFKAEKVLTVDVDRLGDDVIANPGKYGFLYTTDNYIGRGDPNAPGDPGAYPNDGNVFDPNGHYSSAMQTVVAQYVLDTLAGRFDSAGAVPEPSVWALMLIGIGLTGAALRRRRTAASDQSRGMTKAKVSFTHRPAEGWPSGRVGAAR